MPVKAPARRRRRPLSLRTQLGAGLAVLVVAATAALGTLIGQSSVDQLRARIGQSLSSDADRMADRLNKEMAARARELNLIGALDPLRGLTSSPLDMRPRQQAQALLDGLKRSYPAYVWIGISDPQGRVLVGTGGQLVGTDIGARPSIRDMLRPGAGRPGPDPAPPIHPMTQGQMIQGQAPPGQDPWVMDLVRPIQTEDGQVTSIVSAQISWSWVRDLEKSVLSADETGTVHREAFLVSARDEVLLGPAGSMGTRLVLPAVERARAGFNSWTVETFPDGEPYLTGAAFASGEGQYPGPGSQEMRWTVLVREKLGTAFAPAYQLRDTIIIAGAILALVFAGAGWLLAAWITRPMVRIAQAAERLRQGDDVELPRVRGAAEIVSLSASLRALVATLTRKQMALDDMEEIAQRDPLTGLLNRSGLRHYLTRAVGQAQLSGISLLIFMGDLDGFKAVNDTLGHATGDKLLCEIARRLSTGVRPHDAVARLGGDEFVMVLEAAAGAQDEIAHRIAKTVLEAAQMPVQIDGRIVPIGCSFGGAAWPDDGEELQAVMEKADAALYRAKRAGKGRLELQRESRRPFESSVRPA